MVGVAITREKEIEEFLFLRAVPIRDWFHGARVDVFNPRDRGIFLGGFNRTRF
jgi:hypothetical protein